MSKIEDINLKLSQEDYTKFIQQINLKSKSFNLYQKKRRGPKGNAPILSRKTAKFKKTSDSQRLHNRNELKDDIPSIVKKMLDEANADSEMELSDADQSTGGDEWKLAKKPKRKRSIDNASTQAIRTSNKFGILSTDENNPSTSSSNVNAPQQSTKRNWIPPITILNSVSDYSKCISDIRTELGHDNFNIRLNGNNTKIFTYNNNDFDKLIKNFKDNDIKYYTLSRQEEKIKKIVLKAPPSWDGDEIKTNLENQGNKIKEIIPLKTRKQGVVSHSYLITVPVDQKLNDLKQTKIIDHCKIKWESYIKKKNYTQCFRCQRFGHSQANCNLTPRCVKCPENHYYTDCKKIKTPDSKPFCHNCKNEHTANYSKCPVLIDYLQKRNLQNSINNNNMNSKTYHNTITQQTLSDQKQFPNLRNSKYSKTNPTQSYRDTLINDQNQNINNVENDDDYSDLLKLIKVIKALKSEINNTSDQMEKIAIILKYIHHF